MASAVGIGVAMPVLAWMISLGTWNLLQPGFFEDFYDAQARALFHGRWNVPANVVQIEGFLVKGHTFMYFGPFPAFLRMPVLLVTSRLDGRLTELSTLLAVLVALVCSSRLAWKIRGLVSSGSVSGKEAVLTAASMAVLGIGSVFLLLTSQAVVYNEAEAWGAALAIASFDALVGFILRPSTRGIVITAVLVTLDLLARGSVGLGPLTALAGLTLLHAAVTLRGRSPARRDRGTVVPGEVGAAGDDRLAWIGIPDATKGRTRTLALAVATMAALGAYAAVNYMKFGSLFGVPFTAQVEAKFSAAQRLALAANGGSLLGLKFVPTALVQYLRPDALRPTRLFPFITFPPPATVIGHVRYASRTWASSVTSTMPAVVVAAGVGLWSVFRPRRHPRHARTGDPAGLAVLRVPLVGAALGMISSVAYAFIVERYLADWMPLLVLAALAGVAVVVQRSHTMARRARRSIAVVGGVLAVAGVVANLALAVATQDEFTPTTPMATRAQFVSLQQRIDRRVFGDPPPGVTVRRDLPTVEPAGSLVIVGHCDAMYQSNGYGWDPVEQSAGGGHWRLRVTFPVITHGARHYWPLVVTGKAGAGDYAAVHAMGPDEVRFAYLFQAPLATWYQGQPVHVVPGRSYVVDVVFDADTWGESITMDGTSVLYVPFSARQPVHATFGVDAIGGPTTPSFDGSIERLPTPTPQCDALRRSVQGVTG